MRERIEKLIRDYPKNKMELEWRALEHKDMCQSALIEAVRARIGG